MSGFYNSPCKKEGKLCDKRYVGCHSKCKEFTDWKKSRSKKLDEIKKQQELERKLDDTEFKRSDYFVKRRKRRKR